MTLWWRRVGRICLLVAASFLIAACASAGVLQGVLQLNARFASVWICTTIAKYVTTSVMAADVLLYLLIVVRLAEQTHPTERQALNDRLSLANSEMVLSAGSRGIALVSAMQGAVGVADSTVPAEPDVEEVDAKLDTSSQAL
mmetsp:Transcript_75818/g.177935  ORF Transcript_75818/g.177935 Transcript_75818/m.177935 type:complete len:142 (-) Transcript_75818:112-537(-)